VILLIPSIPGWHGDPNRDSLIHLSIPVSIALLIAYVALTWYSLRRHAALHMSGNDEVLGWSFRFALLVLGLATVLTALVAEILVGTLEVFAHRAGLSEFFVAAVIVAIVGNAAEHGGAVVVAARGKIRLATEIAVASAAQVAVFLIPAVVLLALFIEPLSLALRQVEILALALSVVVTAIVLANGQSSRLKGGILVATYLVVAVLFFQAGERF
jgi:Ca2+:H+ antiporter